MIRHWRKQCVLVFNGVHVSDHYCGAIKGTVDNTYFKLDCKRVCRNQKYDKAVDVIERLQRKDVVWDLGEEETVVGDKVLVDKKEYDTLKRKAAQLDQVKIVLGGGTGHLPPLPSLRTPAPAPAGTPSGTPQGPSSSQHEGREDAPGQKKRAHIDFQEPSDVPQYNVGDTQCPKCPHKAKTTHALKLHIMKNHEDKYLYTCSTCHKGFT